MYLVPFMPQGYRHAGSPQTAATPTPTGHVAALVPVGVRVALVNANGTRYEMTPESLGGVTQSQWAQGTAEWGLQPGNVQSLRVDVPAGVYTATVTSDARKPDGSPCLSRSLSWSDYDYATSRRVLQGSGTVRANNTSSLANEEYRQLLSELASCQSNTDGSSALAVGVGVVSAVGLLYLISKKG